LIQSKAKRKKFTIDLGKTLFFLYFDVISAFFCIKIHKLKKILRETLFKS